MAAARAPPTWYLPDMATEQDNAIVPRVPVVKASVLGAGVRAPTAILEDTDRQLITIFRDAGVLEPPFDPATLLRIWENSGALNQNVQAYVTNIDGLGHRFTPRIDLYGEEATEAVRDALWVERVRAAEAEAAAERISDDSDDVANTTVDPQALMPSDEDVARTIDSLRVRARFERARLDSFFDGVNPNGSFETLRRHTRQDLEIVGNAYWEVLRNVQGQVSRFVQVPPTHVRCTSLDEDPVMVADRVRSGLGWEVVRQPKFFRRYVQALGRRLVWFKAFGDPRVVSQSTGKVYADIAEFEKCNRDGKDRPATELVHFRIHKTGEAYGVPRWIGNLLAVLGSRAADEVNFGYFDNKAIPPLALLVSGGRLSQDSVDKVETYIRDNIKGRENFHRILVVEADNDETDPFAPRELPKMKFERLTDAQQGDALFQRYDERNVDKVGSSFRMPRLLRGDVRDFNRATADASLRFADEQVFEPERREFDSWINNLLLPLLDMRMWMFRSLGPQTRDPERVAGIIVELAKVGAVTPNEARELSSDILGRDLGPLNLPWAKQPLQLTLAGFAPPQEGDSTMEETQPEGQDVAAQRLRLLTTEARATARGSWQDPIAQQDAAAERDMLGFDEEDDDVGTNEAAAV